MQAMHMPTSEWMQSAMQDGKVNVILMELPKKRCWSSRGKINVSMYC